MKKINFLTLITFFFFNSVTAQVLYSGDFDNYSVGDLSNDPTGQTAGQGNWFTRIRTNNLKVRIVQEPLRGNVLGIGWLTGQPVGSWENDMRCTGFSSVWNNRTSGNNIFKLEFDFYIDHISPNSQLFFSMQLSGKGNAILSQTIIHFQQSDLLILGGLAGPGKDTKYPTGKWVKFELFLDYNTFKAHYRFPSLNAFFTDKFMNITTPAPTIDMIRMGLSISNTTYTNALIRMDDFKISALPSLPFLDTNNYVSDRFNIYPNPAKNLVNITNSENMSVRQVEIYDLAGKLINTQHFNNETEIQLNIEALTSGTYLMHLHTNKGMAVKRLIKK